MIKCTKEEFLTELEKLVNIDSYSYYPEGTRQIADYLKEKYLELGWYVEERDLGDKVGPALVITNKPDAARYDVLMLGHMDTVFAPGTVKERPFSQKGDFAYGPGVSDMKNGLLASYYACKSLQENGELGDLSICVCHNPDEEIGSIFSRPLIEELGKKSNYVLIMESARINGNFVNERKGIGKYVIEFFGKAAHAAVEPEKGANAVNQFLITGAELLTWAAPEKGTTLNIGIIQGGTTPNTVPAYVRIEVDLRLVELDEGERVDKLIQAIPDHMTVKGVTAKVTGGIARPPMRKNEKSIQLAEAVDALCAKMGIKAGWESSGGGSDGNFTAALGAATIDGVGPVGGHAHNVDECLDTSSIMERLELLYEIIKYCGRADG